MGPEDLVCAACGGRVSQARCATCRASLRRLQEDVWVPDLRFFVLLVGFLVVLAGVVTRFS